MAKIVVIGSLNMDVVATAPSLPLAGETIIGTACRTEPGGKGANQAYAAARLGGDVAMLGRVGNDEYGRQIRANLETAGCDVRGVRTVDGSSGVAFVFVADSGQNSILVVPGANHQYQPADLAADSGYLVGAKVILLQLEIPIDTVVAAARAAKHQGARVILDPAPVPGARPSDLLSSVDVLTPNETEAAQLAGHRATHLSTDDARSIARKLQDSGSKTVAIKLGAQGCLLADGEDLILIPAPKVEAVDTTGAGDVFNAALAVAFCEGATLIEGCTLAVHAASLSVTRRGVQRAMPDRLELRSHYERTISEVR